MTLLLASVRSPAEAEIALAGGADFIDLKEPEAGALGRLPDGVVRACVAAVARRRTVSATIGDVALDPQAVLRATRAMAANGLDIVKIGMFPGDTSGTIRALAGTARDVRLVAVLFADRRPDLTLVDECADAGFHGVMLDTADKASGPLTRHLDPATLRHFVERARTRGMISGLAGSLRVADIAALAALGPDYLGFRSALTAGGRAAPLAPDAVAAVRAALDQTSRSSATATAGAASEAAEASAAGASTSPAKSR
jgi:uncharacterized protein (UPF0264 family)